MTKSLTRAERKYRTEIEEIAVLTDMDIWNVEAWTYSRIDRLKVMRDKFVRVEVIMLYTVIDEILTDIICDYYFPRKKNEWTHQRLWKKKRFRVFVHYLMDELFLLKKLQMVEAIRPIPKNVSSAIKRINDIRNVLAHSLFPKRRRRYMADKKLLYHGTNLFSAAGVQKFQDDFDVAYEWLRFEQKAAGIV